MGNSDENIQNTFFLAPQNRQIVYMSENVLELTL